MEFEEVSVYKDKTNSVGIVFKSGKNILDCIYILCMYLYKTFISFQKCSCRKKEKFQKKITQNVFLPYSDSFASLLSKGSHLLQLHTSK